METKIPFQYSKLGQQIKKILHTKIGAFIGFHLGISGFNRIDAYITRVNGKVEKLSPTYNSRVNAGAGLVAYLLSGTNLASLTTPNYLKYIALSTSTLTPAAADTTLTGETALSGLARALGTAGTYTAPAALDGAASFILTKTFTAGAAATIVSAAIFDAASTGNMFVEANLATSAVLNSGDQLTLNWSVNF